MHTNNHIRRVTNELAKQGVKTNGVLYYNTHQESILSDLVTENYIYNNYRYTSSVNWENEKTPEAHLKN